MNKAQKIVWTIYIIILIYLLLTYDNYSDAAALFVLFGWIPALVLHIIWKDKK